MKNLLNKLMGIWYEDIKEIDFFKLGKRRENMDLRKSFKVIPINDGIGYSPKNQSDSHLNCQRGDDKYSGICKPDNSFFNPSDAYLFPTQEERLSGLTENMYNLWDRLK